MDQMDSDFEIKQENKNKALEAIKALVSSAPGFEKKFSWVNNNEIRKSETLGEAMSEWRWVIEEDDDGNIMNIVFDGCKLGDDLTLFETIAPFVEKGSYIQMNGEDNDIWRWVFNGKECFEIYPTIIWEDI